MEIHNCNRSAMAKFACMIRPHGHVFVFLLVRIFAMGVPIA
jgi:hypothetical protein